MPFGLMMGLRALGALFGPIARYLWIGAAISMALGALVLWDKNRIANARADERKIIMREIETQIAEDNSRIERENSDALEAASNVEPTPDDRAERMRLCAQDKACRSHGG